MADDIIIWSVVNIVIMSTSVTNTIVLRAFVACKYQDLHEYMYIQVQPSFEIQMRCKDNKDSASSFYYCFFFIMRQTDGQTDTRVTDKKDSLPKGISFFIILGI